jgi:Cys-rich radical ribosomally synthesized peptide
MIANQAEYAKMFGEICSESKAMARCACVSCNSCTCSCACRRNTEWEGIEW